MELNFLVKRGFNAKDGNERRLVSAHGAPVTRCREVRCLVSVAGCLSLIGPSPYGEWTTAGTFFGGRKVAKKKAKKAVKKVAKKKVAKKAKKKAAKKK
jgi:hypothetical protein